MTDGSNSNTTTKSPATVIDQVEGRNDRPRALIVDWGGVLTTPLSESLKPWLAEEGIDPTEFKALMREWLGRGATQNPAHDLEAGRITGDEFGALMAERIKRRDGSSIEATGVIQRMFRDFEGVPEMSSAVLRARAEGITTALLSNSWGNTYPHEEFGAMFDDVVISGEVGMRKPDIEIYELSVSRLGLQPQECVFVDDLPPNIRVARSLGMIGVLHETAEKSIAELESIFSVQLH